MSAKFVGGQQAADVLLEYEPLAGAAAAAAGAMQSHGGVIDLS